jgi:hypothetical protein
MTHSVNHQKPIFHLTDVKKAEKYQNQQIFNLITWTDYATIGIQIALNGFIKFREFLSFITRTMFVSEAASNYVRTRESYLIDSTWRHLNSSGCARIFCCNTDDKKHERKKRGEVSSEIGLKLSNAIAMKAVR